MTQDYPGGRQSSSSHLYEPQASVYQGREEVITNATTTGEQKGAKLEKHLRATLLYILLS